MFAYKDVLLFAACFSFLIDRKCLNASMHKLKGCLEQVAFTSLERVAVLLGKKKYENHSCCFVIDWVPVFYAKMVAIVNPM